MNEVEPALLPALELLKPLPNLSFSQSAFVWQQLCAVAPLAFWEPREAPGSF